MKIVPRFVLPRIKRIEHEALLLAGVHSRDLILPNFYDLTMEGTLHGLCSLTCELVHYFNPHYRLARLTRQSHYFLIGSKGELVDLTERSYSPILYRKHTLLTWKPLSRRATVFLARVREELAQMEKIRE